MRNRKDNSGFGWDEHRVIKQPVNSNIAFSLIMTNLLPYMQNVKPLGNMLKQLQILLKK
ncbi:hypothetical protein Goarm_011156 [Gossypium armourianum]|uniref:Myb/SANT-like domain-containing protein n=1 Tax=Gossypium armourianum TaxID=34283 RepID=A0A7J9IVX5_9ROSI|nr:hypothetical protein [Gossypium armourianum]